MKFIEDRDLAYALREFHGAEWNVYEAGDRIEFQAKRGRRVGTLELRRVDVEQMALAADRHWWVDRLYELYAYVMGEDPVVPFRLRRGPKRGMTLAQLEARQPWRQPRREAQARRSGT